MISQRRCLLVRIFFQETGAHLMRDYAKGATRLPGEMTPGELTRAPGQGPELENETSA